MSRGGTILQQKHLYKQYTKPEKKAEKPGTGENGGKYTGLNT